MTKVIRSTTLPPQRASSSISAPAWPTTISADRPFPSINSPISRCSRAAAGTTPISADPAITSSSAARGSTPSTIPRPRRECNSISALAWPTTISADRPFPPINSPISRSSRAAAARTISAPATPPGPTVSLAVVPPTRFRSAAISATARSRTSPPALTASIWITTSSPISRPSRLRPSRWATTRSLRLTRTTRLRSRTRCSQICMREISCSYRPKAGSPDEAKRNPGRPLHRSRPKWFRFGKAAIGLLGVLQHRADARLLATGEAAGGECLLGATSPSLSASVSSVDHPLGQFLVHLDVVEVAERVLQLFQPRHEFLPAPRGFLAGERAGEEFRRIAQLLCPNAQLVAAEGIELVELCALFENLFPVPAQRCCGCGGNRPFTQRAGGRSVVMHPITGFDPGRSIENETTKTVGFDRRLGAGKCMLAFFSQVLGENRHAGSIRLAIRDRFHHPLEEHVEFARRRQFPADPFEFRLHPAGLRVSQHIGEERDRRAQPPQRDSRLVQPFRVALLHGRLVGDKLAQALPGDG